MHRIHYAWLIGLATVAIVLASPAAQYLHAAQAVTELEGTWDGDYSSTEGGKRVFKPGEVRMTFKGNKIFAVGIIAPGPDEHELSFVANSKVTPKTLDYWEDPSKKFTGIYDIQGDTLRIGLPRGTSTRPTAISGEKGSQTIVLALKKRQ